VLDITAACINARVAYGFPPAHVLQSVGWRSAGRGTYNGGFAAAALGLAMHFMMAFRGGDFYALSGSFPCPRDFRESWLWECLWSRRFRGQ